MNAKTTTKVTKKKVAAAKPAGKPTRKPRVIAIDKTQTKVQVYQAIAEKTQLPRKDVVAVFDSLNELIASHLAPKGSGEFTIPNTGVKIRRVTRKATAARKGVNPFSGEPMTFPAKPARNVIKLSALKALKEKIS
ncbi:MAG: HU family DNA-binding protein [Chromatiales bacterium]|nr:HU family DNA-binding protein [Chromatiales bacterium]